MTTNRCTLYVARHGETESNILKKVQWHTDSPIYQNGELLGIEILNASRIWVAKYKKILPLKG